MFVLLFGLMVIQESPLEKGVTYLSAEVPRWRVGHECRSCHHQGDGARALLEAKAAGLKVADDALLEAVAWLAKPEDWDRNGPDGPFNDQRVARLQFASALTSAVKAKSILETKGLNWVAQRLVADQAEDGSWSVGEVDVLGTPVTRGRSLATILAIETLSGADPKAYDAAIAKAQRWILSRPLGSTLDAAVVIREEASNTKAMELLIKGESVEGGWGPYPSSSPEVFDTSVVLWALSVQAQDATARSLIRRGRKYLIGQQLEDGSWPETTRPSGSESLAQRVSTTAWAVLALVTTRNID